MLFGLFLFGLGIVLIIRTNLGYTPWDVFHAGLANITILTLGTASIIVGLVILIALVITGEKLGLGAILNMLLVGIFIDVLMIPGLIPEMNTLLSGSIMLIVGLFAISFGSYFYIGSGFGAGPRDALMVVLTRVTKIPVGICRSALEIIVTIAGWFLGGLVGIGTIVSAIGIGFCIEITFKVLKFDVTSVKHESLRDTFNSVKASLQHKTT